MIRSVLAAAAIALAPVALRSQELPASSLAAHVGNRWVPWWTARNAPHRWSGADSTLAGALQWRHVRPRMDAATLELAGSGEAYRVRVIVIRIDPRRYRLTLTLSQRDQGLLGAWTVDSAPPTAALAVNAGQFVGGMPWGWLVRDGVEASPPAPGPLSTAVVIDTSGNVRLVTASDIAAARTAGGVASAFQTYPTLLIGDGIVPPPLRAPGGGVDVAHRDARLALGVLADGRLLVVLTRFDALGGALDVLPFGLTTPETAALMGALGARQAVMLDGGISAQLVMRDSTGIVGRWRGLRRVPLALIATERRVRDVAPAPAARTVANGGPR